MRSMVEEALWTMQAFPSYMPRFCEGNPHSLSCHNGYFSCIDAGGSVGQDGTIISSNKLMKASSSAFLTKGNIFYVIF